VILDVAKSRAKVAHQVLTHWNASGCERHQ
jgi:hypothetical protein